METLPPLALLLLLFPPLLLLLLLLPRRGLDGEEAGGGTSHSLLPPGTAAADGPRRWGRPGRRGRIDERTDGRQRGAATAAGRRITGLPPLPARRDNGSRPARSQPCAALLGASAAALERGRKEKAEEGGGGGWE